MGDKLQLFRKYRIRGAQVGKVDPRYRRDGGPELQWIINGRVVVQELPVDSSVFPVDLDFVNFADVSKYVDVDCLIG